MSSWSWLMEAWYVGLVTSKQTNSCSCDDTDVCFCLQVFVLLFIFVKRQIMRFAMRSRRGPHAPIGHNAPKVQSVSVCHKLGYLLCCQMCCWCRRSWHCVYFLRGFIYRDWERRLTPGWPKSRRSVSSLVSFQKKMIGWSMDHRLVSHIPITFCWHLNLF